MRTIRKILPAGLRWRLTIWVAGVMLAAAAAIFLVVYNDTGNALRHQIDRDIASDTRQLSQAIRPLGGVPSARIAVAAQSYLRAQPYTATSTLLFLLVPGQATVSNHPEVFGTALAENGEGSSQQTIENAAGRRLLTPKLGYSTVRVPDAGPMRIHERLVSVGTLRVIAGAGQPLYLVESAQHDLARAFIIAGAVILVLALLASYLAGARVSAPLRRMAAVAARVDSGDLTPRMDVSARRPDELLVLGEAFNHMLDRLEEGFRGQREFIADASHELRTPLTVMRGQLDVLAAHPNRSEADVVRVEALVQAEISRMARLVEDLLLLAKAEQSDFVRPERIELPSFIAHLWDGVTLTAKRRFELGPVPKGTLVADPDRLAQALRNLLRNAIEHTAEGTGLVRLEVARAGSDKVRFTVGDDGPGIPVDERERAFQRFHRTDAARNRAAGGAGLGLAIVRAVAEAHGGQARATGTEGCEGARLELVLPGFKPTSDVPAVAAALQAPIRA